MSHRSTAVALSILATLLLASSVAAGGWAVATLDGETPAPTAGEPFDVTFTLMQHGVTPVNSGTAIVVATGPDGRQLTFTARRAPAQAHWIATVTLPSAGTWQWRVELPNQLEVESEDFATLQVAASGTAPASGPLLAGILALAALAVGLFLVLWRPALRRSRPVAGQAQRS